MRPNNSSALALAGRLRDLDDAALAELIRSRAIRDGGVKDFFDLADRLFDANNLQATLARLDRPSLRALAGLASPDSTRLAELRALALVDENDAPYLAVTDALAELPGAHALDESAPAALEALSNTEREFTDRIAAERAFITTFAVLEIVAELERAPARELAKGGVALPDSKRLATAASVHLEELPALLAVAASAGLIELESAGWRPARAASDWQHESTVQRWVLLASAWIESLPLDIRTLLSERKHSPWGEHLADYVRWLYPASGDRMHERMNQQLQRAHVLGITAENVPSSAGSHLLANDPAAAVATVTPLFPVEIDTVYLQHDLTIVAPGPLQAPLDSRLRELADVENRGLATTYRVSAGSLNRAIAAGDTAETVRDFLDSISMTGIPQPLDYLIDETARRHGLVRVVPHGTGSAVRSSDARLLDTIRVDHNLYSLGLHPAGEGQLESRLDLAIVYWALSDARYPVAAENAGGEMIALERQSTPRPVAEARDTAGELVARLRASAPQSSGTGAAWLERQLELAIKARVSIIVVVRMPSGEEIEHELEPTGLGGGRLRARDRKADIERTLPLVNIIEVRELD